MPSITPAAATPNMAILEMHVSLLTQKLSEAEARVTELSGENDMLRDQLHTMQFESSMQVRLRVHMPCTRHALVAGYVGHHTTAGTLPCFPVDA